MNASRSHIRGSTGPVNVGAKLFFGDSPTSALLDLKTVAPGVLSQTRLDLHDHREREPDEAGEFRGTNIETIHVTRIDDPSLESRGGPPKSNPRWAGRSVFRYYLQRYKDSTGLTNAEVAPLLSLKPKSLQKYLYGTTHRPGIEVLTLAAKLFGCRLGNLV